MLAVVVVVGVAAVEVALDVALAFLPKATGMVSCQALTSNTQNSYVICYRFFNFCVLQ